MSESRICILNDVKIFEYPDSTISLVQSLHKKMKFSIKDFFSKYDQIRGFLRICSHLLKKSLMDNFIFCAVILLFFQCLVCAV